MTRQAHPDQHGYSEYVNHGCRCDVCRAANAAWQRRARQRRNALLISGEATRPHGTASTYTNYLCRCDLCRAAHSVVMARRNRTKQPT